jgi:Flp pilus assembly protein TadD
MSWLKDYRLDCVLFGVLSLILADCGGPSVKPIKYPPPPPPLNGKVSLNLADSALADGQPTLALHATQALLEKNPSDAAAWQRQGDAYFALGQIPEAEQSYRRAVRLAPAMAAAQLGLGRVELTRDPVAAETRFGRVAAADASNTVALNDLGIARDLEEHHAEAQAAYRQALAAAPGDPATEVNLALSLALSGQPAEAITILAPLATRPDATPRIRQDYAVALVLAGRIDEAQRLLGKDLSPEDVAAAVRGYELLPDKPAAPVDAAATTPGEPPPPPAVEAAPVPSGIAPESPAVAAPVPVVLRAEVPPAQTEAPAASAAIVAAPSRPADTGAVAPPAPAVDAAAGLVPGPAPAQAPDLAPGVATGLAPGLAPGPAGAAETLPTPSPAADAGTAFDAEPAALPVSPAPARTVKPHRTPPAVRAAPTVTGSSPEETPFGPVPSAAKPSKPRPPPPASPGGSS